MAENRASTLITARVDTERKARDLIKQQAES